MGQDKTRSWLGGGGVPVTHTSSLWEHAGNDHTHIRATSDTRKPRIPGLSALQMVRTERLELSHLAAPEPKSGVSTNFTTSAFDAGNKNARHLAWRLCRIWGGRWESNPRHQEPQSCALPTELRPPYFTLLVPRLPNGTPGRTRTCDHPLRRRMLYPAELRALDHLPEQTLRSFRLQQKP